MPNENMVNKLLEKYTPDNGYARFITDLDSPNFKMWVNPFLKEFIKKEDGTLYLFPMKTMEEFDFNLGYLGFYYVEHFKGFYCGDNEKLKDEFRKMGYGYLILKEEDK